MLEPGVESASEVQARDRGIGPKKRREHSVLYDRCLVQFKYHERSARSIFKPFQEQGVIMETQTLVPLDKIDSNPYQPRQTEDTEAVAEIAESIKRNGLMQIPTARQVNGRYQLAFGHTRLAALRLNGEDCMPLIIRELGDLQMFELGVAENIKRRDLNAIEEAESMRRYMDEFGMNSVEAGEFFNVSPEKVRQAVRLLNLPEAAQEKLAKGTITQTTARTLLSLQKVAPEEALVETLERLEKGVGRYGFEQTPDEIIDGVK